MPSIAKGKTNKRDRSGNGDDAQSFLLGTAESDRDREALEWLEPPEQYKLLAFLGTGPESLRADGRGSRGLELTGHQLHGGGDPAALERTARR